MRWNTISEVCAHHQAAHAELAATAARLTPEAALHRVQEDTWSAAEIIEHIAMVDLGIVKIITRLMEQASAAGSPSDGSLKLSQEFLRHTADTESKKLEAPAMVQPTAGRSIAESLERLAATQALADAAMPMLERFDPGDLCYPHPYFGDLNAHEWFALRTGHLVRHHRQLTTVIGQIKA